MLGLVSLVTSAALGAVAVSFAASTPARSAACPPGALRDHDRNQCVSGVLPESYADLATLNGQRAARSMAGMGELAPGALVAAAQAKQLMTASSTVAWHPVGAPPLIGDANGYGQVNTEGFGDLSGRVQAFAADPARAGRLFAGIAGGGVFESVDSGTTWHSVGDTLPNQTVGAIAWTAAGGGTLVVGTGDPAFGGDSASGSGIFFTVDDGRTWQRSGGVPDTLSFRLAVDPTTPSVVYAATGKGLWRSADAGRTFVNDALPTGCSSITQAACFFANMVTDVVVRPSGPGVAAGGSVLAAVGWRAGPKVGLLGKPQSPANGIYVSTSGAPGSFTYVTHSGDGFAAQALIGRTALGIARGAGQDHDVVFALVQDAGKLNKNNTVLDLPDLGGQVPNSTVLNGVYVSQDFGTSWKRLADATLFEPCGTGSALCGLQTPTYSPGVQSWYNEWIEADPTTHDAKGRPTRIALGLEEVWQNDPVLPTGQIAYDLPATPIGLTTFRVFGRYYGGNTCLGLKLMLPVPCPTNVPDLAATSTTHPDQHAGLFLPDGHGGLTLLVGNDGGVYTQHVAAGQALSNSAWGRGANKGLDTLQAYGAAVAKDGTVYSGLQDNGEMKITPEGHQYMVFGGDAFLSAVDPNNSKIAYEEYTNAAISETTDGGLTWTSNDPGLDSALFSAPLQMDPTDASHLVVGGREVAESAGAVAATKPGTGKPAASWNFVYDLGLASAPGQPAPGALIILPAVGAVPPPSGVPNQTSALDVRGAAVYAGFCGYCDVLTGGTPFARGIATNVGGSAPPKWGTGQGWHIAKAIGLPVRYITSIRIDPANTKTVYVTLGGYSRRWVAPGAIGDNASKVGAGHVFKSTDAGDHFTDISGNLPDVPANWSLIHDGHLVVATDLGVFVAPSTTGGSYQVVGAGLPNAAVFQLTPSPASPDRIYAATYGRGVWSFSFSGAAATPAPSGPAPKLPVGVLPVTGSRHPWVPWAGASAAFLALGLGLLRRRTRSV